MTLIPTNCWKIRQADPDPHDRQQPQRRAAHVGQPRAAFDVQRLADLTDLGIHVDVAQHAAQHLRRFLQTPRETR